MKKVDLGQTLSILANLGVITGIVILAIEIRDSNNQARVASQIAYTGQISGWFSDLGTDEDSAEIYRRGLSDFAGLSESERDRFDYLIRSYLVRLIAAISAINSDLGFTGSDFETRQMHV